MFYSALCYTDVQESLLEHVQESRLQQTVKLTFRKVFNSQVCFTDIQVYGALCYTYIQDGLLEHTVSHSGKSSTAHCIILTIRTDF